MRSGVGQEPGRGQPRLVPQPDGYAEYVDPSMPGGRPTGPGQHRSSARRTPGEGPTRNIPTGSFRIKGVEPPNRGQRPIRNAITWLLVLPLITMIGLYIYAASGTIGPAVAKQNSATVNADVSAPLRDLSTAVQAERADAFTYLASHGQAIPMATLTADEHRTDRAVAQFKAANQKAQGVEPAAVKPIADELIAGLNGLNNNLGLRDRISLSAVAPLAAFDQYNNIVSLTVPYGVALANPNSSITEYQESQAQGDGSQAIEKISEIQALLGGVIASGGYLTQSEYTVFLQAYQDQIQDFKSATLSLYWQKSPDPYLAAVDSQQYHELQALELSIVFRGPGQLPLTLDQLKSVFSDGALAPNGPLQQANVQGSLAVTANDNHEGDLILFRLAAVGGAGLLVVIISAILLLRFGNRITRELTGLRGAAQTLAGERLPSVVRRLRAGDDVDVAAEAPPLELKTKTREVSDTADAFSAVQHTAVEAAVEQAELRKGVSNVFRSLARRNQSLVQRQLRMLDEMEHGTQDPDALAQLFRLDHLTTRMRRQAEGLIILSGAAPGRRWRQPVPVVEVLRGAISEIEDYVRVDLVTDSPDYLTGAAVADVTHLLAELIENAVVYSPPATRVQVRGGRVANGYVIEVEDRGLGIPATTRDHLNERLAQPPEFDLADSDQLGLFVVSRLAVRNEIKVSLRESGFGGTTAIVLLPAALVVSEEEARTLAAQGARGAIENGGRPSDASGAAAAPTASRRAPRLDRPASPADERDLAGDEYEDDAYGRASGQSHGTGSYGGRPAGRPGGGQSFGGGSYGGNRSPGGSSYGSGPSGGPGGGQSYESQSYDSQSYDSQSYGDRSSAERSSGGGSYGGRPSGNGQSYRGGSDYASSGGSSYGGGSNSGGSSRDSAGGRSYGGGFFGGQSSDSGSYGGGSSSGGPSLPTRSGGRGSFGNPAPFQDAPAPGTPDWQALHSAAGDGGGQSAGTSDAGLPRRQKMASLAPQLRDSRSEAPKGSLAGRSPEQARALLSSIQRGLRTGRDSDASADRGTGDQGGASADDESGDRR